MSGQLICERAPDGLDAVGPVAAVRSEHDIGDELTMAGPILAHIHEGVLDLGRELEPGLDLRGLHAIPAHLHLAVRAAEEVQLPVAAAPDPVARPVHPRVGVAREGIREERGASQVGPVYVAARHAVAGDPELSVLAVRHGSPVAVEHVQGGVRLGDPDRDRFARLDAAHLVVGGRNRRLGRPVAVHEPSVRMGLEEQPCVPWREDVATRDQEP